MVRLLRVICPALMVGFLAGTACAEPGNLKGTTVVAPPQDTVWAVNCGMQNFSVKGQNDHSIRGMSALLGFGRGYFVNPMWMLQGQVEVYSGPWSRIRDESFDADFSGGGASIETIHSFSRNGLRTGHHEWVGVLSLAYQDLSGKSIGANRHQSNNANDRENFFLERSYKINMSGLWLTPSLGWTYFRQPRPGGNSPDLLTSRIEGVSIRTGIALPILTRYRATYIRRSDDQTVSQEPIEATDRGYMHGYSAVVSLHTWIGT